MCRARTRPPGKTPLPAAVVERVDLTLGEPPGEATQWTGRAMIAAAGISLRSVQRIWAARGLLPNRIKRFKLSKAPDFAAKLQDIVGLYVDPPARPDLILLDLLIPEMDGFEFLGRPHAEAKHPRIDVRFEIREAMEEAEGAIAEIVARAEVEGTTTILRLEE